MHPSGVSGANFEAFLGPRSSRFEPLRRFCVFGKADRGLGRIASLTSIGRTADCTFGHLAM
eukprot:9852760-Alexandrium_andersonii.AAC.1